MIQQISNTEYRLTKGNHQMTLLLSPSGSWEMMTSNPATRAWNRLLPSFRRFGSLAEVEQAYKSWRGIASLAAQPSSTV
jgi:hypothetical protein